MKHWKFFLILLLVIYFALSYLSMAEEIEKPGPLEKDDLFIPPGAHDKAVRAVKALGPGRGAKKIDYRVVKILGIVKGIKAESRKIETVLKDLGAKETKTEF
jgi:hypothetical protein